MDKLTITGTGENSSEIINKGSVNYNELTGIQTYEFDPIIADTYTMKAYYGDIKVNVFTDYVDDFFTTTFDSVDIP